MPAPKNEWLTQTDLAARLDVDVRWIRTLHKRGLPFNEQKKKYPWPESLHWYVRFKEDAVRNEFRQPLSLAGERARREGFLADKAEFEIAQLRGDLFSGTYIRAQSQRLLEQLITELRTFKGRWRHELIGRSSAREVDPILDRAVEEMILRLREVVIAAALLEEPHGAGAENGDE